MSLSVKWEPPGFLARRTNERTEGVDLHRGLQTLQTLLLCSEFFCYCCFQGQTLFSVKEDCISGTTACPASPLTQTLSALCAVTGPRKTLLRSPTWASKLAPRWGFRPQVGTQQGGSKVAAASRGRQRRTQPKRAVNREHLFPSSEGTPSLPV